MILGFIARVVGLREIRIGRSGGSRSLYALTPQGWVYVFGWMPTKQWTCYRAPVDWKHEDLQEFPFCGRLCEVLMGRLVISVFVLQLHRRAAAEEWQKAISTAQLREAELQEKWAGFLDPLNTEASDARSEVH